MESRAWYCFSRCHISKIFILSNLVAAFLLGLSVATGSLGQTAVDEPHKLQKVRAFYEAAQKLERDGEWSEAEKAWREALSLAPADARAWTNLGVVLNKQSRTKEAIEAWRRAITLDQRLAGPHLNIGLTLVKSGSFAEAISPLRRTLALEPTNDGARRALAVALIGVDRFPEATREIAQLLARSPRDVGLLEMAAQTFIRQQRYSEAVVVLRRRLDLPAATGQLWAQYGDALDGASRTTEALEAYRKAVELDQESTLFRYALGYVYWKLYRYDEAESELLEVLRRDPADPRAAFTLGDLYLTKGEAKRALPLLERAAAAYPNEFDTRFALGRALVLMGNIKHGIEELRAAINIDDSIADGHFQLGRALLRAGSEDEGKRELEKARVLQAQRRAREAERFKKLP